ncbi:MAG: ECF-type sigma factor [Phycisphaerales bacterium]|nr:ECF-type sigma factor [Phycisphaerales bacterium]
MLSTDAPPRRAEISASAYRNLRRMAHGMMRRVRSDHTLDPTALAHEVFLRMAKSGESHAECFPMFAVVRNMREVLIDHERRKRAKKRGGASCRVPLDLESVADARMSASVDLIALDEALNRMEQVAPQLRAMVELRYFAGMSLASVADWLDVSVCDVRNMNAVAKRWLARYLGISGHQIESKTLE